VTTKEQGKHPWIWSSQLTLIEAKKAFQRIDHNLAILMVVFYVATALIATTAATGTTTVFVPRRKESERRRKQLAEALE